MLFRSSRFYRGRRRCIFVFIFPAWPTQRCPSLWPILRRSWDFLFDDVKDDINLNGSFSTHAQLDDKEYRLYVYLLDEEARKRPVGSLSFYDLFHSHITCDFHLLSIRLKDNRSFFIRTMNFYALCLQTF